MMMMTATRRPTRGSTAAASKDSESEIGSSDADTSKESEDEHLLSAAAVSSVGSMGKTQLRVLLRQQWQRITSFGGAVVFALILLLLLKRDTARVADSLSTDDVLKKALKLTPIQTQVVHRHGDRTPITPLEDESYWSTLLPPDDLLSQIGQHTNILRQPDFKPHPAGGGAVFGRLTSDGLSQMRLVGVTLRSDVERLFSAGDGGGMKGLEDVDPSTWLKVASTDFSRTIQSVQAVLTGLLDSDEYRIDIDARHTLKMIPDPQPRRYLGQAELERKIISGPAFQAKEKAMKPLAIRMTDALFASGVLGEAASKISFGVGEDETAAGPESPTDLGKSDDSEPRALPWNQLAEILKCLERRDRLPEGIKSQDLEDVAEHNAWRWFALLGDKRLAAMAIKSLAKKMILNGAEAVDGNRSSSASPPLLHIFSGHDATLIALMCFFRIKRPDVWPEYGSYMKMELLRDDAGVVNAGDESRYFVLFSLNGEPLQSSFGGKDRFRRSSSYLVPWLHFAQGLDEMERGLPSLDAAAVV